MFKSRSDLPLEKDASVRFLPWLVAFMVYLAALSATAALAMNKVVVRWDQGLAGQLTVQIPPPGPDETAAAHRQKVSKAIELLSSTEGVRDVEELDESDIGELLEPWLGETVLQQNLPLPVLLSVTLDGDDAPTPELLTLQLTAAVPDIIVDDHQRWLSDLFDLARTVETIASLVVVAVGLTAMVTVVFVTRTGLSIHRRVIDLLHLIGAQDTYIARQFEAHALRLGLQGGMLGVVLAIITVALIGHLLTRSESGLLPDLSLAPAEWMLLLLLPVGTSLIAMVTARLTVLLSLARMG